MPEENPVPSLKLLHDALRHNAARSDSVAIRSEQGSTLTYAQLNAMSNRWARYLLDVKVGPRRERPFVGLLAPVSAAAIGAALGILKAGFAYVPLDDRSPSVRLRAVVQNAGIDVIIADPEMFGGREDLVEDSGTSVLLLDRPEPEEGVLAYDPTPIPEQRILADDLAYVLYTSGSTGVPKGIMHTHRSACAFVAWMQKQFRLSEADVVMSRAPWHFDLSVFDVFNTLAAGSTVVTYDWVGHRDDKNRHRSYVDLVRSSGASVLYTTPSTFIALMERGGLGERPTRLKKLMYAGEPFPTTQLQRLAQLCPDAFIANIYGPTETNIITCQLLEDPELLIERDVPIGREVDDVEIILVAVDGDGDGDGELCGPGEVGELWCRGSQVTTGYLGNPEQTEKHLVRSPFHAAPAWFWRTGDLAVRDAHGVLHYRGRRDHLVKINGFRVELGEIESAAGSYRGVGSFTAVAIPAPNGDTGSRLHSFYTSGGQPKVSAAELREHLAQTLPEYMVPSSIRELNVMPTTSSGKVDRNALRDIVLDE
jgi:amino acid adenylation domain-containing protein